ncbi:hypothetical protein AX16_006099 [Volvariella volvacea WC 439]|nr:hypothetical protein AX16_006099 [Volvariella volvacea WC 439]
MPHKRAKRSARVKLQNQIGNDLAPGKQSITTEAIPKSAARVLNAAKIRAEYAAKKRKREEEEPTNDSAKKQKRDDGKEKSGKGVEGKSTKDGQGMKIQPGESMQHFVRRVENDMRPLVKAAMRTSLAVTRKARKDLLEAKTEKAQKKSGTGKQSVPRDGSDVEKEKLNPTKEKHSTRPKEFETLKTSAPRRLNDIVQAPPEIKRLPRGADQKTAKSGVGKHDGVVSMAQKAMMEEEREKAIARYRALRASQRQQLSDSDPEEG